MGKYRRIATQSPPPRRPWAIHPIWRGFGCLLLIVGPFMAFAIAHILVEKNMEQGWFRMPSELMNTYTVPGTIFFMERSFEIGESITIQHFYADLITAVLVLLLGFALVVIVYSMVYGFLGPRRLSPLDSPPIRRSQKRKHR